MEWIEIPAGVLMIGDNRLRDAAPQHQLRVNMFSIGKFPVTNGEFAEFIEASGYTREIFWTKMGWKWRQSRGVSVPGFWNDPEFNAPRQPVVGVSWYEAAAFCKWLSARESAHKSKITSEASGATKEGNAKKRERAKRVTFRLPTEAEWEYAARGANRACNFPWGDQFEPGRANTAEAGFGRTTPVDYFPNGASVFGVWGMSGNVFEWTLSKWGANWQELQYVYPYYADDGREEIEGSAARVMRGGSWFNPYPEALCAYRSRYLAGSRGSNIGFRVVKTTESE